MSNHLKFTLIALLTCTNATFAADRPNVLIIHADDLGYGETGVQGCKEDLQKLWDTWSAQQAEPTVRDKPAAEKKAKKNAKKKQAA